MLDGGEVSVFLIRSVNLGLPGLDYASEFSHNCFRGPSGELVLAKKAAADEGHGG